MRKIPGFILALALSAVSCGGSGSPSSPTPTIPTVNGSYSGTATLAFPEIPATLNCSASTVVTQSGSNVSIAPIVLTGTDCGGISLPLGQVTIDATGSVGSETGSFNEPSCGTYNYSGSGGFFGRELRLSLSATSATCYNFNFTTVMSR